MIVNNIQLNKFVELTLTTRANNPHQRVWSLCSHSFLKASTGEGVQTQGNIRGAWADKEDGRLYSDKWLRFGSMVL